MRTHLELRQTVEMRTRLCFRKDRRRGRRHPSFLIIKQSNIYFLEHHFRCCLMGPKLCPQFSRVAIVSSITPGTGCRFNGSGFFFFWYRSSLLTPSLWSFLFGTCCVDFPTGQVRTHMKWLVIATTAWATGSTPFYYTWPLPKIGFWILISELNQQIPQIE